MNLEIEAFEAAGSYKYTNSLQPSAERTVTVVGTENEQAAYNTAWAWLGNNALTVHDLVIESVELSRRKCGDIWDAKVKYGEDTEQEESEFSFQTTTGSAHISQSFRTVTTGLINPDRIQCDFKGGIGFEDGTFRGVDVKRPRLTWNQTHVHPASLINMFFIKKLASLSGAVNSTDYGAFSAGEVMFLGVSQGSRFAKEVISSGRKEYFYKLTYQFEASPNASFTLGEVSFDKRGWDYFWVLREKAAADGVVLMQPRQYFVEEVYPYADLHMLGIPIMA